MFMQMGAARHGPRTPPFYLITVPRHLSLGGVLGGVDVAVSS